MRQYSFFKPTPEFHGGTHALGKRKTFRPLATRKPIHLVLISKKKLYRHSSLIAFQLFKQGELAGVKIFQQAVAADHVHLVIGIPSRDAYKAFARALTGILARSLGKKLWALLPFTRVANWGRDYENLRAYLLQNRVEAGGWVPYKARGRPKYFFKRRRQRGIMQNTFKLDCFPKIPIPYKKWKRRKGIEPFAKQSPLFLGKI